MTYTNTVALRRSVCVCAANVCTTGLLFVFFLTADFTHARMLTHDCHVCRLRAGQLPLYIRLRCGFIHSVRPVNRKHKVEPYHLPSLFPPCLFIPCRTLCLRCSTGTPLSLSLSLCSAAIRFLRTSAISFCLYSLALLGRESERSEIDFGGRGLGGRKPALAGCATRVKPELASLDRGQGSGQLGV